MQLQFRPAQANDVDTAVPLIYSSGPQAFDYGFAVANGSALAFLRHAFVQGGGFFGHKAHVVATFNDEVVGIGSFYSGHEYKRMSASMVRQVFGYFPLRHTPCVLRRALHLGELLPAPKRDTQYIANLGVRPELRSQRIGAQLLENQRLQAIRLQRRCYALDVSVENPRAQALYEKLGFAVVGEQIFPGPQGLVPNARRMELVL